jgi:DNA mismatch endonuclease (patch repair protein)
MDNLSREDRRKNMQNIRSKETKMEVRVRKELWERGIRYRKNVKNLPGNPDIAIKKYKIVVFLDSCFFHGCPLHFVMPATNQPYWEKKITRNIERDQEINLYYKNKGWSILRFWEHETKKENINNVIDSIFQTIQMKKSVIDS